LPGPEQRIEAVVARESGAVPERAALRSVAG
jgi:hypothetical protein